MAKKQAAFTRVKQQFTKTFYVRFRFSHIFNLTKLPIMPLAPQEANPFKPVDANHELLKKTIISNWIMLMIPLGLVFFAGLFLVLFYPWLFILSLMGAIASSAFVYVKISSNQEKFTLQFRESVVMNMIKSTDSSINYEPKSYFNLKELMYSGLLERAPNIYEAENYFEQKTPLYTIEIAWAYAIKQSTRTRFGYKSIPRQSTTSEWMIHGLFYKFTLPKRFNSNVIIRQDRQRGFLGMLDENPDYVYNNFFHVPFDNKDFEKEFEVYAQDDREAQKLVTEELMQLLLDLRKHYRTKVQLSLIDNAIYMTVDSGKKYFKPGFILSKSSASVTAAAFDAREIFYLPEKMNALITKMIGQ